MDMFKIIPLLSLAGLINAAYLTWIHLSSSARCGLGNCHEVILSPYGSFLGLPVAVIGAGLFTVILTLSLFENLAKYRQALIATFSSLAVLISIYFIVVQITVLKAFCPFCYLSAILFLLIWVLSLQAFKPQFLAAYKIKLTFNEVLKLAGIFILPLFIYLLFSFYQQPRNPQTETHTTDATMMIGKHNYTIEDVDDALGLQVVSLKKDIYNLRKGYLETQLLEKEAKKNKQSKDRYLNSLTKGVTVPYAEINDFYEDRKSEFPDTPLSAISARIEDFLRGQKEAAIVQEKLHDLKAEHGFIFGLRDPSQVDIPINKYANITKGPEDAPIKIIEFSDLECPYCKRVHNDIKKLMDELPGKIQLTFRHFPLAMHGGAKQKAIAAACLVKQDKFWPFIDEILKDQKAPLNAQTQGRHLRSIGANYEAFNKCKRKNIGAKIVEEDLALGEKLGVYSTPTLFINGSLYKGLPSKQELLLLISQE